MTQTMASNNPHEKHDDYAAKETGPTGRACMTRELEQMLRRTDVISLRYPGLRITRMLLYLVTPGQQALGLADSPALLTTNK